MWKRSYQSRANVKKAVILEEFIRVSCKVSSILLSIDSQLHFFIKKTNQHLTLKKAGGGSYVPTAQEIACHFSQDHARVLKLLDFFKNDVGPRVKESF